MTTVTLFKVEPLLAKKDVHNRLNQQKANGCWFRVRKSKGNKNEMEIDIWYEEDLETGMKKIFQADAYEMAEYIRERGKDRIIRKVYCFINVKSGTLEIYRGIDGVTYRIKGLIEKLLKVNLTAVSLDSGQLLTIVKENSSELKQAMFKYIHGLWYHIIRGNHLENNNKYRNYLSSKPDSLRVISIKPKIKYINGSEYMITINGDKGTIKMSRGAFNWRPRLEVKQIVSMVAGAAGLPIF